MTTSRQKAIGSQAERNVAARFKNGRRVGMDGGPIDVIAEPYALQVKCSTRPLSLNAIQGALDKIPAGALLRGVVVIDRPGSGKRTRYLITFDLDEFVQWHG